MQDSLAVYRTHWTDGEYVVGTWASPLRAVQNDRHRRKGQCLRVEKFVDGRWVELQGVVS